VWPQRPSAPARPDPAWSWPMQRKGQILHGEVEMILLQGILAGGLGGAPGSQPAVPAAWGAGCAAVQGAGSGAGSSVGLGAGEMLLALLPSPRCSIFAEEPRWHPAGERHAQIFFPVLPSTPGLEETGKGRCSLKRAGMLIPGPGIQGTTTTLDRFFPVVWGHAAGPAGCVRSRFSSPGTTTSPFPW